MENVMGLAKLFARNRQNTFLKQLQQHCTNDLMFTQSRPVPLPEVKDIFRFRAKHNETLGEPIQGFRELIAGLETFSSSEVVIYSIDCDEGSYKVFADADRQELAGVLKFPKKPLNQTPLALSELQAA